MRRGRCGLAAAVALVVAVAGCGFPAESEPRRIAADDVDFDLLSPTTATATTLGDEITKDAVLFLVDAETELLSPVTRRVAEPKNAATVLRALFDLRPTKEEAAEGLTNVITSQTRLLEVIADGDGYVLDLASYFPGLGADEVSLAIAQIVFTLDDLQEGVHVSIYVEGVPEDVRTDEGKSVRSVSVADLQDFDPQAQALAGETTTSVSEATAGGDGTTSDAEGPEASTAPID